MLNSTRRRKQLLDVGKWLADIAIPEMDAAGMSELVAAAQHHAEQSLLLALPDGAVEFRPGNDAIPVQRNGITLIVPGDTQCKILDAMFEIAEELEAGTAPLTTAEFLDLVKKSRTL
jgi:hypothetical protein